MSPKAWIDRLDLQPHPEGGWYRETYRSPLTVPTDRGVRAVSTAILYLLGRGDFSALHRIRSDEIWHHHAGGALEVVELTADGVRVHRLGPEPGVGDTPQVMVPAGAWFGARPAEGVDFALVGCTVAPGFDFDDFEMGDPATLRRNFPHADDWITRLSRDP